MVSCIAETSGAGKGHLLEGTNSLFISKDHVRSEADQIYVIFMARICPSFVLGHLIKEEERKKITIWPISMYTSVMECGASEEPLLDLRRLT